MTKLEDRAYTAILARERYYEREVSRTLKTALDEIRGKMAVIYERYAVDGALSKADMTRYNRYATMERDMLAVVNQSTRETLRTIERLRPEQYGESFFRTAWVVDNTITARLAWGKLNKDAVIANLANEFYYISKERYGVEARLLIRSTLAQGVSQGVSYQDMSRQLARTMNILNWRAMRIIRTEGQTAVSAGQDAAYVKAQEQGVIGKVVWDATLDERTRSTHGAMDGQVRGEDGMFDGPGGSRAPYPGFPDLPAKERINCVTGSTRVAANGLQKVYRRKYSGKIVTVKTAGGVELQVTPNHPVLTENGWVNAGSLVQGQNIISLRFKELGFSTLTDPNKNSNPPVAAQVFELFSVVGRSQRTTSVSMDFHGDGWDSDVDVISLDGKLLDTIKPSIREHGSKLDFSYSDVLESFLSCDSPFSQFINASASSTDSIMRSTRDSFSFVDSGSSHPRVHSFTPISSDETDFGESIIDRCTRNTELIRKLFDGNTGLVQFDEIVNVNVDTFSGHVYNLETKDGYYTADSSGNGNSGAIVHNCRCRLRFEIDGFEPAIRRTREGGVVPYQKYDDWKASRATWK